MLLHSSVEELIYCMSATSNNKAHVCLRINLARKLNAWEIAGNAPPLLSVHRRL